MVKSACAIEITIAKVVVVIFFVMSFSVEQSLGQRVISKIITGRILDTITKKPIADVIVVNKNTNKTTLSDNDGYFYIPVRENDSIVFYLVGYYPKKFLCAFEDFKKQVLVFFLKPNIEELHQIEVTAEKQKQKYKYPFNQVPSTVFSPINFLYEKYSKKYKQYRKIEELENKKYYERLRESRFNKEFVKEITGIPDDEIEEFMKQCRFDNNFLLNASDYDFIVAIQKKYSYYSDRR